MKGKKKKNFFARPAAVWLYTTCLEVMLQFFVYGSFTWGMFYGALFAMPFALACCLLSSWKPEVLNRIILSVLVIVLDVMMLAQFVYFQVFGTYMQFFSVFNGAGNAAPFTGVIKRILFENWYATVSMLLALLLMLWAIWGARSWKWSGFSFGTAGLTAALGVFFHVLAVLLLYAAGTESFSPCDLYFNQYVRTMNVKNLGLITGMRQDAQRLLLGGAEDSLMLEEAVPALQPEDEASEAIRQAEGSSQETGEDNEASKEEVFVPEPNVLEIDFDQLIAEAPNDTIASLHSYFASRIPTMTNTRTGQFEGYNLIQITAESFATWGMDPEITPTLWKMAHSGFVFKNFYQPYFDMSTTDGEFMHMASLLPNPDYWSTYHSSMIEMPFALGNVFNGLGYSSWAFHNFEHDYYYRNLSHPNMGYVFKAMGAGLHFSEYFPTSDLEMMEQTVRDYVHQDHFNVYYMTLSGHLPYKIEDNEMMQKNWDLVKDLSIEDDYIKGYYACEIEFDRAMEYLLDELEKAGVADHTLISICPDHYTYGLTNAQMSSLAGYDVSVDKELYRNTWILYCPGMEETVEVEKTCCSLDIYPTLANLFNLPFDSRLCMGTDVFSDTQGTVIFSDHSFLNDDLFYNSQTGEIRRMNPNVSQEEAESLVRRVNDKFQISSAILDNDYYSYLKAYLPWWDGQSQGYCWPLD